MAIYHFDQLRYIRCFDTLSLHQLSKSRRSARFGYCDLLRNQAEVRLYVLGKYRIKYSLNSKMMSNTGFETASQKRFLNTCFTHVNASSIFCPFNPMGCPRARSRLHQLLLCRILENEPSRRTTAISPRAHPRMQTRT